MSLHFRERQDVTVTRTQRRARIALGCIFTTIGTTGIGLNVVNAFLYLGSDRPELAGTLPATSLIFLGSLGYGIKQFTNRNKPTDIQLPNLTHNQFLESTCGRALIAVGILRSAEGQGNSQQNLPITLAPIDPANLKVEEREVLKDFIRTTQPIVDDMKLPHLSPEMRQQQEASICFHATEAARRLREYQEAQRAQQDGRAWGSIAGSGYIPED
jgi:hypothetical protein